MILNSEYMAEACAWFLFGVLMSVLAGFGLSLFFNREYERNKYLEVINELSEVWTNIGELSRKIEAIRIRVDASQNNKWDKEKQGMRNG